MAKPVSSPKPNRVRGMPVQFYLSAKEKRALQALCRKRETSVADIMRRWIWRSMLESGLAKRRKAAKQQQATPQPDPRQLDISEAIGG
jgi:hypothetical protein